MGFSTMEGTSDSRVEDIYGNSKYGSSSLQTIEMHSEVRKGIKLLKRSIACVSSYGYSHLLVPVPFNMSTFQMLTELLFMLSSKDVRQRYAFIFCKCKGESNAVYDIECNFQYAGAVKILCNR